MSNKIQKINNLKKHQGFVQLNFTKGFKYVDKAGEFINHFCKDNTFPDHAMNPSGMVVRVNEKTQLKTSPHHLWMHFIEPDTFDYQRREFGKKAILINSIFEPAKYTRIGWRNYLIYESGETYPSIIPKDFLKNSDFHEIVFTKKLDNYNSRISVSKLVDEVSDKKAILFDIDIYKKEDVSRNDFSKIQTFLSEISPPRHSLPQGLWRLV